MRREFGRIASWEVATWTSEEFEIISGVEPSRSISSVSRHLLSLFASRCPQGSSSTSPARNSPDSYPASSSHRHHRSMRASFSLKPQTRTVRSTMLLHSHSRLFSKAVSCTTGPRTLTATGNAIHPSWTR
jgi:hypothetical protein